MTHHPYDLMCDRCAGWGKLAMDDTSWYIVVLDHGSDEAAAEAGFVPKDCPDCGGTGDSPLARELNAKGNA